MRKNKAGNVKKLFAGIE